jgi:phage-related minor tail protein
MASEQTTGILAAAGTSTREMSTATHALKELAGAAGDANTAMTELRKNPRVEIVVKTVRQLVGGAVEGAREGAEYNRAISASGNYAGVTKDQLRRMEVEVAGDTGTRAKAAEALSALVASGRVQGRVLQEAATAAVEMNRVTGVPIKDVVEKFSKIAGKPLEQSAELNKEHHYLDSATVKRIDDLETGGKVEDAAAVAQKAFAAALTQQARQEAAGKTLIDRLSQAGRDLVARVQDVPRNLGRGTTQQEDHDRAATRRDNRLRHDGGAGLPMAETPAGAAIGLPRRPASPEWTQAPERDREVRSLQARSAASRAESARGVDAELNARMEARNTNKASKELASAKPSPLRGGGASAQLNGIQLRVEVTCGHGKGAAPGSQEQAGEAGIGKEEPVPTAGVPDATSQPEQLLTLRQTTEGIREQTAALEAQNAVHGKSKSELRELNILQLERQLQDLEATESVIPGYVEALGVRIEAEKGLLKVTRDAEGLEAAEKDKKKNEDKARKMSEDIGGAFREGFVNLLEGKENALDKMGESLKKKIVSSVADALYDASLKPAVEAFSGWLSGAFKGASSSGGSAGSDSGGSWFGSLLSGVLGIFGVASAKGNVFASPGLHAYANSVVGKPTFFPFANGIGLMGEAGPEAIMPLRRGSDGRLGVSAQGSGGGGSLHYAPSSVFYIDSRSDRGAVLADLDRALQANNKGQMEQLKRLRVVPQ